MKRTIVALATLVAAISMAAMSPEQIISDFRNEANAEYVHVPKFLMKCAKAFGATSGVPLAANISSMTVLNLSDVTEATRARFRSAMDKLKGYDTLVSANDDGEQVQILTKVKGNRFENFYILVSDSTDCSLIKFAGKFSQQEIQELIDKETKK